MIIYAVIGQIVQSGEFTHHFHFEATFTAAQNYIAEMRHDLVGEVDNEDSAVRLEIERWEINGRGRVGAALAMNRLVDFANLNE